MEPSQRKVPPRVPYNIDLDADNRLKITKYHSPHLSTEGLLHCVIDMMNTAFSAVWKQENQHPLLENHKYYCAHQGVLLIIEGDQVTAPLEYSDLVVLGNLLLQYQQQFITPGISFELVMKGVHIAHGYVLVPLVSNTTQSLSSD